MNAALPLAIVAALAPVPAPSPQPSPLKQIIDVKARALCTTLGTNVAVTLVGLMKDDQVIEEGRRAFVKMAWDQARGSKALDIDRLGMKNAVAALVHNLSEIDRALDDPLRFPAHPTTDDERAADRMKAALQAVEDRQKLQLNILNGTVETDALAGMRHDFPDANPTVNAPNQGTVPTASPAAITDAGLQQPKATATAAPATDAGGDDFGVAASSAGATFAHAVSRGQTDSATLESQASAIIVPLAHACRAASP